MKVTRRLCREGFLRKFPLIGAGAYYVLGKKAAQQLGLPASRTEPLGPQSLPLEYAILAYCALGRKTHRRLTDSDVKALCPSFPGNLLMCPICLDEDREPPILELMRVDLGGPADHVARKSMRWIRRWMQWDCFTEFCREGRLRLVVLTASSGKAQAIKSSLTSRLWPEGLLLHLAAVPELVSLTAKVEHGPR